VDPLLEAILKSRNTEGLIQQARPEWARMPEQVGGQQSVNDPLLNARRFAAPTQNQARLNVARTAAEEPADEAKTYAKKLWNLFGKLGVEGRKDALEELVEAEQGGKPDWRLGDLGVALDATPYALGVMGGAKAAENLGGKTLMRFLLGKKALAEGKPPQEVWRTHGVELNKEGHPIFEFPLVKTEEELMEQFRQAYPDLVLRSLRKEGPREGSFHPGTNRIYAQGAVRGPEAAGFEGRRTVMEHEVQHAMDKAEGFSYGTQLDDPDYWKNAAEVRARNAEARLMDPELRNFAPSLTEDAQFPREMQIIKQAPGAVAEAVKEKGGMWHPEAVERLGRPLVDRLAPPVHYPRGAIPIPFNATGGEMEGAWATRAISNYLNKHAGTATDPLKDVEVPFGEGVKRWEELTDSIIKSDIETVAIKDSMPVKEPVYKISDRGKDHGDYSDTPRLQAITSYLSHVGDYLRQNVPPEKLQQYDLVRAVKETAVNDARVAKEMERAAAASMKDLPVYKDYSAQNPGTLRGMKWVELKKPERLTEEQAKAVSPPTEAELDILVRTMDYDRDHARMSILIARDAAGKPIKSFYTNEWVTGSTPEEAHLAGQLAQEGNQMGHCVGGYCEGVASGESKIYSLRDAKGKSHVTVEVGAAVDEAGAELPWTEYNDILQIKGKQNRAPNAEYLPYVQDFVRSGKWGEVGDLGNTGLHRLPNAKDSPIRRKMIELFGEKEYYTTAEREKAVDFSGSRRDYPRSQDGN